MRLLIILKEKICFNIILTGYSKQEVISVNYTHNIFTMETFYAVISRTPISTGRTFHKIILCSLSPSGRVVNHITKTDVIDDNADYIEVGYISTLPECINIDRVLSKEYQQELFNWQNNTSWKSRRKFGWKPGNLPPTSEKFRSFMTARGN